MERAHPAAVKNYTQLSPIRAHTAANCSPIKYTLYCYLRSNGHEKKWMIKPCAFSKVIPSQGMRQRNKISCPQNSQMWWASGQGFFVWLVWFLRKE